MHALLALLDMAMDALAEKRYSDVAERIRQAQDDLQRRIDQSKQDYEDVKAHVEAILKRHQK